MSYVILSLIYSQRLSGPHSVHLASLSLSNIVCRIMFPEQVILFSSQFQGLMNSCLEYELRDKTMPYKNNATSAIRCLMYLVLFF